MLTSTNKPSKFTRVLILLSSLPISLTGLLALMRALEISNVYYFQTIYRITHAQPFLFPIAGNFLADAVVTVSIGVLSSAIIFYRRKLLLYTVPAIYAASIAIAVLLASTVIADILALSILPIIATLHFLYRNKKSSDLFTRNSMIQSTTLLFFAIEVGSLLTWVLYPVFASKIYSSVFWYAADIEAKLFYAFGLLSAPTMLVLLFSFGIKPSISSIKAWWDERFQSRQQISFEEVRPPHWILANKKRSIIFLTACSMLVVSLSIFPYLPSINKEFRNLSVDTPYYVSQIDAMRQNGVFAKGVVDQQNDRTFSLLIFYSIVVLSNQPTYEVVAFLPIPLGISMVISVFFFMRSTVGARAATVIAPIITAFSTQFIVGYYAGFFSNLLAIAISFVAMLFYLKYQATEKRLNLIFFGLAFTTILLTHIYTWIFMLGTFVLASVISILTVGRQKTKFKKLRIHLPMFLMVALNAAIVIAIALTTQVSGAAHLSDILATSIGQDFIAKRWQNINYTFSTYLGGFLTNTVLIGLALLWTLRASYRSKFDVLLMSSIFVSSLVFFLGDTVAQSRLLLIIPLQIPAALSLGNLLNRSPMASVPNLTRKLVVILLMIHLANYGLRSLANFYLPQG